MYLVHEPRAWRLRIHTAEELMGLKTFAAAALLASAVAYPLAAQQPVITVNGDNVEISGCLARVTASPSIAPTSIVWSRGDLMLASAAAAGANVPVGTSGVMDRVFYWLDEEDDLTKHIGKHVRIKGEVDDFEKGEIEIERKGDHAEVTLEFDGKEEKIRMPLHWLGRGIKDDVEFDFVARKVDVDDVDVIGPCTP
jgi:hypothetical protein